MKSIKPGTVYIGPCRDDGDGFVRDDNGRPIYWICYETGRFERLWESFDEWWECLGWSWTVILLRPLIKPFAKLAFRAGQRSAGRGSEVQERSGE